MKYLKTYEECTNKERMMYDDCRDSWFWRVSNEYPDILVIFDKLGVPEDWGDEWLWRKDNYNVHDFYLFKTELKDGGYEWSLGFKEPYWRKPAVYMGELKVTDEDRKEYEAKKVAKKYNM